MTITSLPPPPVRGESPATFSQKAAIFVDSLVNFTTEVNSTVVDLNIVEANCLASEVVADTAIQTTHYKGEWSTLTGSLAKPASVSHNGSIWLLKNNLANVTTQTPSTSNPNWLLVSPFMSTLQDVSIVNPQPSDTLVYYPALSKWFNKSQLEVWGVDIDLANSNPSTSVTYTDDAIGMIAGHDSWDSTNLFKDIKPCLHKNGAVVSYLKPDDYASTVGNLTADITSGTAGDVMIEIPKMWVKVYRFEDLMSIRITRSPVIAATDSEWKAIGHTRLTGGDKNFLYVGAYLSWYGSSSKLRSLSGKVPTASMTIGTARTRHQANGTGYDSISYEAMDLLRVLYLIKYKSLDSQSALGQGYISETAKQNTGSCDTWGMYYGDTSSGYSPVKFAGVEDIYGNLSYYADGIFVDDIGIVMVAFTGFSSDANYVAKGWADPVSGFISGFLATSYVTFIPSSASGSSSTYVCDYGAINVLTRCSVGSSWNDGLSGGMFASVWAGAGTSYTTTGARMMFL